MQPASSPKAKSRTGIIVGVIVVVIVILLVLYGLSMIMYVWVSGNYITGAGPDSPYQISIGSWSNATDEASATVISTSPNSGIKYADIIFQLYDLTDPGVETTGVTWTHTDADSDGYVEPGDIIKVTFSDGGHTYRVRAITDGSQIYESASFIF